MNASDIQNLDAAPAGRKKIAWAQQQMPVLRQIQEQVSQDLPLKGLRVGASLHITSETARLAQVLKAAGAEVALCACNPLSTQDEVAAALVSENIQVFARRGEDNATYYKHIDAVLDTTPHLLIDNGGDLITEMHKQRKDLLPGVIGATEETTTGIARLNSMARSGLLKFPVISVNDAKSKYLFDNRYGTGQSTLDAIMRSTNALIAGKKIVVAGYGWCGKGIAARARGLGAIVTVVEINPMQALEAAMDGFVVTPMERAATFGDIFITATGDINVIRQEHFEVMKSGTVLCNAGHFNSEIEVPALEALAQHKEEMRPYLWRYEMAGKHLFLLAEGRLVNLTCGEGHPAAVMDMSFANQLLTILHLARFHRSLGQRVYPVPQDIDERVALLKLQAMGIELGKRTQEQEDYQMSWEIGT